MESVRIAETPLTDETLSALIALSRDWEAENSCFGYRANAREDIEGNRVFLAYDGEGIVGYLFGHVFLSENMRSIMPEGTACFEVEELYVIPARRSEGIGSALFRHVADDVRADAEYLILSTAVKNWRAIFRFYLEEMDMTFWSARLYKRIR